MRVLITGGAGFIGTNLCSHLIAVGGYAVTVLDELSAGQSVHHLPGEVEFVFGDYTDPKIIAHCLRGNDAVVHLAALSGVVDSIDDPVRSFRVNVQGSFQLLKLACEAKISRFIHASTGGALFGDIVPPISEEMAPSPLSPYGASKLAVEAYCSAFTGAYGLSCVALRFSSVYGPHSGHKRSVIAAFIKNFIRGHPLVIYGDGTQRRDYLYVGDLVKGIEAVLKTNLTGVYQLGYGRPTSLATLVERLEDLSNRRAEIRHRPARRGEVHSTWCNIEKACRELGYSAPTSLEAGLRQTWTWYIENQALWSDSR